MGKRGPKPKARKSTLRVTKIEPVKADLRTYVVTLLNGDKRHVDAEGCTTADDEIYFILNERLVAGYKGWKEFEILDKLSSL